MKKLCKLLLLAAVLLALGLLPFRASDVAELIPVRTVVITRAGDAYQVDVGQGLKALGKTLAEALDRMRREAPGEIFFRTAEQVVVTRDAADVVPQAAQSPDLRPAAGLYLTPDAAPDAEAIAAFLSAHPADTTLARVRGELRNGRTPRIPTLRRTEGGYLVTQ